MDTAEQIAATQASAAHQLAAVAADLEHAAANAPTPSQRLLLMRQLRKVQEAHRALTQIESVNTQSVPIQLPAAIPSSQESRGAQSAPPRGLSALLRRGR
jgi:hypothetical protein